MPSLVETFQNIRPAIRLIFKTKAKPKQSARFRATEKVVGSAGAPQSMSAAQFRSFKGSGKRTSIVSFQDKSTVSYEKMIMWEAKAQMPPGFCKMAGPIKIDVTYRYKMPKIFTAPMRMLIQRGGIIYKITRPDLTDNMNKGIIDAIKEIVFNDDAQVADFHARKIYGMHDEIEMIITPL